MGWQPSQATRSALRATIALTAMAAVLMPLDAAALTSFAMFSGVSLLIMCDFAGTVLSRTGRYAATGVSGAVLVAAATLVAGTAQWWPQASAWLVVGATLVVGVGIQTATILGGAVAQARMALLLAWILPVTLPPGPVWPRVTGWLLGGAVATVAAAVLWPRQGTPRLAAEIAARATLLADRMRALTGPSGTETSPGGDGARGGGTAPGGDGGGAGGSGAGSGGAEPAPAVERADPGPLGYRPFGTSSRDHALHRCAASLEQATWFVPAAADPAPRSEDDRHLDDATAAALRLTARLVGPGPPPADVTAVLTRLASERDGHRIALIDAIADHLAGGGDAQAALDRLDEVLPVRLRAVLTVEAALHAARARRQPTPTPYLDGVPGIAPEPGAAGAVARYTRLIVSALAPGSVWLRSSVRVAVGIAVAVLIAVAGGLDHGFWVVLGTLSVLRSTAFATGRRYLQAVAGTLLGFAISTVVVELSATGASEAVLWAAFPISIFLSSYAPAAWHFIAGQAAFTTFVVVLLGLEVGPTPDIGLDRVIDIAVGGAVSLLTCAALWPSGSRGRLQVEAAAVLRSAAVYVSDGFRRAVRREPAPTAGEDRSATLRAQFRAGTAQREAVADSGPQARAWAPVLDAGARLRLAGDMLERAAEFGSDTGPPKVAMAPAADDTVASALLVAAEVESGRSLRLHGDDTATVDEARRAAADALREWGGRPTTGDQASDAMVTAWTYTWLRWTHATLTRLSAALEGSPVLRPERVHHQTAA